MCVYIVLLTTYVSVTLKSRSRSLEMAPID